MTHLLFVFCFLLSHAAPYVFADNEVVLDASNVTGWRTGNCSYRYLYCDNIAECQDGVLDDVQYHRCTCPPGIAGDGFSNGTGCEFNRTTCDTDDECHQYGFCNETDWYCECTEGYAGDGFEVCQDINDCQLNPCHPNAMCTDTAGSFICTCDYNNNYEGDGFNCTHRCNQDNHCHPDAVCKTKERKCTCRPGYTGDGVDCVDIDECQDPDSCPSVGSTCVNQPGSFTCECSNGYVNKDGLCVALPRDCEEIRLSKRFNMNGFYLIDPDFQGPANQFLVFCDFRPGYAVTVVDTLLDFPVPAEGDLRVEYGTDHFSLGALLTNSTFCYQSTLTECDSTFSYSPDFMWMDAFNNTHTSWAGSSVDGQCGCGQLNKCSRCYCGGSLGGERDFGFFVDKAQLPVTFVRMGSSTGGQLTLGSLKCGPRVFDIPTDCESWKLNRRNKNGPYYIDPDGPSPTGNPPFLVYCDLHTYPYAAITEVQVQQTTISLTTRQTVDVNYIQGLNNVLLLVDYSAFCVQRVEYVCQNSGITGGRVYVNVSANSQQLTYFPGANGVVDSCACGATHSCQNPDLRCDCDLEDGVQRRDLGDIIHKEDLPVRSVTGGTTVTENYFVVSHLRCGRFQFGIPANCENLRLTTTNPYPYTYVIDPDGAPVKGNQQNNVPPFIAQCIFNDNPDYGITVIHHSNEIWFELSASFSLAYLQVSVLQLQALKQRSTFCVQKVDIECRQFSLTYNEAASTWTGLDGQNYAFSDTLTSCTAGGGCQCDGSDSLSTDSGLLTDRAALPIFSGDLSAVIGQLTSNPNAVGNISVGPLECSELFPSCSDLYQFVKTKTFLGETLPEIESTVTIDSDGAGNVTAFEVQCKWPDDTVVETSTPEGEVTVTGKDVPGKSQCFDIAYTDRDGDPITPEQLIALRDRSDNCFQTLSVSCKYARVHGMVNYTTCDGVTQIGWAGSMGQDSCQCGITGHCEGGPGYKCHCDLEDGNVAKDGAVIIRKDRLPVCQVCLSLDGIPSELSDVIDVRRLKYYVSALNCHAGEGKHVRTSCQRVRLEQKGLKKETTGIVYMHPRNPIPAACRFFPSPPVGQLEVFPEQQVFRNVTGNLTLTFRYYTVNMTILHELMEMNVYCSQKVYFFCMPDGEDISLTGSSGWRDFNGDLQQHWDRLMEDEIERSGVCDKFKELCERCGPPRGYVVYRKALLPITSLHLTLPFHTSLVIDSARCSDLFENCYEIMDDGSQRVSGVRYFAIDPDGPGGVDPLKVHCQFKWRMRCAINRVDPSRVFRSNFNRRGYKVYPWKRDLFFQPHSIQQIQALANISSFCWQPVKYECTRSRLINKNHPLRSHYSLNNQASLSFGTGNDTDFVGCACGVTGTCGRNRTCHCDANSQQPQRDEGFVTRKELLPVTQFYFARQYSSSVSRMTVGPIRCSNTACDQFPRDCQDALTRHRRYKANIKDFKQSGEVFINPNPRVCKDPFLVYCEMDTVNNIGITKVITRTPKDTVLRPGEKKDVEYHGPTEQQIRCLIDVSKYCIQPVAYECYKAQFLGGGVYWESPGVPRPRQETWGGGDPQTCACGATDACGGDDSRTQQLNRECNCDAYDERWRKDAGVLLLKHQMPVMLLDLASLPFFNDSRVKVTIGDLICGQQFIEFDECSTGFHDCHERADCTDTTEGFTCNCRKGWEGKTSSRATNPDLPVANGRECFDDDECSFNVCPIGISDCENTAGSFRCHCHDGYRKTGPTTCEDIDECRTRRHDCDVNARCINQDGTFKCHCYKNFRGSGKAGDCHQVGNCVLFGDPHTFSFDDRWVNYQGVTECPLVAATDACPGPNGTEAAGTFKVLFTPWRKDPQRHGMGEFTWVKSLQVHINGHVIDMLQERELVVDGIRSYGYTQDGLVIFNNGRELVLKSVSGIEVYWDGDEEAEIFVSSVYSGKLCGMCGNMNANASDDWIVGPGCNGTGAAADGTVPTTENESLFGNSWMVPSSTCVPSCAPAPPDNQCVMSVTQAKQFCNQIFDRKISPFKTCLRKLDQAQVKMFQKSCVYDVCHVENDVAAVVCEHAAKIAKECQLNTRVNVSNWRRPDFCSLECGANQTYRTCEGDLSEQSGPTSCQQLRVPEVAFNTSTGCVEGCYCSPGYLEEGPRCVREEDCGCFHNGSYMLLGLTLTSENCNESVVCNGGGVVDPIDLMCGQQENCSLKDNVVGCHCVDGYLRAGDVCIKDPCDLITCSQGAECVEGQCQCITGYYGDCESCHDVDECASQLDYCKVRLHEVCVNSIGSYHCNCKPGYVRVQQRCKDVDECQLGIDQCPANSQCVNEEGDYTCSCCMGFSMSQGQCVWTAMDTDYFNASADDLTCCDCNTPDCDKTGTVCGSDGETYPSIRALVVQSCLDGRKDVQPMYEGQCESNCSQVQCLQPYATCEELPNGLAACGCPTCTNIDIQIINLVCASNNIIYRSECEFQAAMCLNSIVDVIIINDPSHCLGNGVPGGGGGGITEWTDCSVPCGLGHTQRTVTVNGQEYDVTAVCYAFCGNQTCTDFHCDGDRECVEGARGPQCSCPRCRGEVPLSVCGVVGEEEPATFRNECELKKAACLQHVDHIKLENKPCQRQPVDCGLMDNFERRTDQYGCTNSDYVNYPTCKGGCGQLPDECCYKTETRAKLVPFKCPDESVRYEQVVEIQACSCIPPEQLEALLAADQAL